jgi:glycosyl hydrolase family 36
MSILDETAPFLEGRPVNAEDDSYYDLPGASDKSASVYQHCVRAILHGLRFGTHGLPLIGSGDWNDGMNLVGRQTVARQKPRNCAKGSRRMPGTVRGIAVHTSTMDHHWAPSTMRNVKST